MTTPIANVDNTTLNNLTPNLDTNDIADPALRKAAFQYIYTEMQTIITAYNAFVAAGGVATGNLADLSVTTAKLADLAVTTGKIPDLAIVTAKINDLAVTAAKIAVGTITSAQIADLSIATGDLADALITTAKLADLNVTTGKLADASVTLAKMAAASVGTSQLVDGSVTDAKIAGGTITADKFVAGALNNDTQNGLLITALTADVVQRAYNVKSAPYNAKGDGVTDDTTALNTVLALAGKIMLPAGTFLISSDLLLQSNTIIEGAGRGKTIIKLNANSIKGFYGLYKSNITIRDLTIDGSGSIDNTGIRGGHGIYLEGCTECTIDNVEVYKMGATNTVAPATDTGYGGYGIVVKSLTTTTTESTRIVINNCYVWQISGSTNYGDGISIIGDNTDLTKKGQRIIVSNCFVTTCGRHCYSISGNDSAGSIPEKIKFIHCFAEKSALSGLDIEVGNKVSVLNCTFTSCGNDQTFYNPAVIFGVHYRLLAAIATTTPSGDVTINNNEFYLNYCGISVGNSDRLIIIGNHFNGTTYAGAGDIYTGASATIKSSIISNNISINSAGYGFYLLVNTDVSDMIVTGNEVINAIIGFRFLGAASNVVSDIIFKGNNVRNCVQNGVIFEQLDGVQIEGNIIKDNGSGAVASKTYGIYITNVAGQTTTKYIIANNRIYDTRSSGKTQTDAIKFAPTGGGTMDYFIITGNDFRNNTNAFSKSGLGTNGIISKNQGYVSEAGGSVTFDGTGAQTAFVIPHGLAAAPTSYAVDAGSAGANALFYLTADATNITATYAAAPASGTGNVILRWNARI